MTQTLPQAAHEHHARLLGHVDRMPAVADALLERTDAARDAVVEMTEFLAGTLVPHMEAAERSLYPELERLLQNRHSMAPMRREHAEVRRLVATLEGLVAGLGEGRPSIGTTLAIRRVMFQLYALVKVHLGEEEEYLHIVEQGVTPDVGEMLAAALEHPGAGPRSPAS